MKPQCCAKDQKHQPALQPPQDSLTRDRYLYHDISMLSVSSVENIAIYCVAQLL